MNDYGGHAFVAQLSRELAQRGAVVEHTHCSSYTGGKGKLEHHDGDPGSLTFTGLDLGQPFAKHSIIRRFRQERQYGRLLVQIADTFSPDVIISSTTPLFTQVIINGYARRTRTRFIFWVQDLTSIAMGDELAKRFPIAGGLAGAYLRRLERRLLQQSDAVVVITPDFLPTLERWAVDESKVVVIENWAPLDELPVRPRRNAWSRRHGLDEGFVFLYAGTLGLKHNPELLVSLAKATAAVGEVRVVVVSEGSGADYCRRRADEEGLRNLLVLPFQPYDDVPDMLATADVAVVILEAQAGVFSVPSKVLSYHCAARPLLAAVTAENLAARLIVEQGSGLVVSPSDASAFVQAGLRLLHDDGLRTRTATYARAYAESAFDIATIADRFARIVSP
ncbi:MAG: glycosyltransferase family 4 protein [Candidatus Limnocylindrales bacterium]